MVTSLICLPTNIIYAVLRETLDIKKQDRKLSYTSLFKFLGVKVILSEHIPLSFTPLVRHSRNWIFQHNPPLSPVSSFVIRLYLYI